MKLITLLGALLLSGVVSCFAQNSVSLTWAYNFPSIPLTILANDGVTPLNGAGTNANGDGFVLQLGYYTGATSVNPFLGTWVPVFGPGTSNSLFSTASMGDNVATTGTNDKFSFSGTITDSTPSTEIGIPAAGQIMTIRYYNAASLASSTFFGAVSDPAWVWESPSSPPPTQGMSFRFYNDSTAMYQGGATAPETNLSYSAVPEPASVSILAGGLALAAILRRRR